MKFLFSLILIVILGSCGCSKNCIPEKEYIEKQVTVREIVHDTIFVTKPDSSQLKVALTVDTNGHVKIQEVVSSYGGKKLKIPDIKIKDNILTVDCRAEAEELFVQWKETYTDSVSKTVSQLPPILVEKDLSNWQIVQIWLGRIFILVFIVVAWLLFLKYWPKK